MPAERTRGSRRTEADGTQLVWTMPVEPASPSGIAFATNVTPVTFKDAPASSPPPCGSFFIEQPDEIPSPRRATHSRKKPENHTPRPPNAFILFRSSFIKSQHVSTEVETNHSTLSKIIGLTWRSLPEEERQVWHTKAKAALEEHKRKFPQYAFKPSHAKGKGGTAEKRKVREVEPKDLKRCAKIAELLVNGKKGQELDAAIQAFDKYHVPEIITRFEKPITARAYRRSSSVPAVDPEEFIPSKSSQHRGSRARASSARIQSPPPASPISPKRECSVLPVEGSSMPSLVDSQCFHPESPTPFNFHTSSPHDITSPAPLMACDPLSDDISSPFDDTFHLESMPSLDIPFSDPWAQQSVSPTSPGTPIDPWTQYASPTSPSATDDWYLTGPVVDPSSYMSYEAAQTAKSTDCSGTQYYSAAFECGSMDQTQANDHGYLTSTSASDFDLEQALSHFQNVGLEALWASIPPYLE